MGNVRGEIFDELLLEQQMARLISWQIFPKACQVAKFKSISMTSRVHTVKVVYRNYCDINLAVQ